MLRLILVFILAVASTACGPGSSFATPSQQGEFPADAATDYASFIDKLRAAGASAEAGEAVDQAFFSVRGRMIEVGGEEVQVFQYIDAAAAEAEAALVSADGSAIGTHMVHWIEPPHFYKKGKLLVLYVGDNEKILKMLVAVLDRPFAGK